MRKLRNEIAFTLLRLAAKLAAGRPRRGRRSARLGSGKPPTFEEFLAFVKGVSAPLDYNGVFFRVTNSSASLELHKWDGCSANLSLNGDWIRDGSLEEMARHFYDFSVMISSHPLAVEYQLDFDESLPRIFIFREPETEVETNEPTRSEEELVGDFHQALSKAERLGGKMSISHKPFIESIAKVFQHEDGCSDGVRLQIEGALAWARVAEEGSRKAHECLKIANSEWLDGYIAHITGKAKP